MLKFVNTSSSDTDNVMSPGELSCDGVTDVFVKKKVYHSLLLLLLYYPTGSNLINSISCKDVERH